MADVIATMYALYSAEKDQFFEGGLAYTEINMWRQVLDHSYGTVEGWSEVRAWYLANGWQVRKIKIVAA